MTRGLLSLSTRWLVLTLLASLLWSTHAAHASNRPDVVNPEWIPADAEWVLHVNFEAIAASELMTALCGEEAGSGQPMAQIRSQMEADLGFDLFAHAKSVTFHGRSIMVGIDTSGGDNHLSTGAAQVGAVAVLSPIADEFLAQAIEDAGEQQHLLIASDRGDVHRFGAAEAAPGEAVFVAISPGSSDQERIAIVAPNIERIELIRDAMSGQAESIATIEDPVVSVKARHGSLLYFSGASMQDFFQYNTDGMVDSRVIKMVNNASFELSEQGRLVRLDISLDTDNEDAVRRVRGVIQGMVSLGQMMSAEVPELEFVQTLTDAIRFNSNGSRLTIGMALNVNDVRDMAQTLMADYMPGTSENAADTSDGTKSSDGGN